METEALALGAIIFVPVLAWAAVEMLPLAKAAYSRLAYELGW